jgi:hypothetical protein
MAFSALGAEGFFFWLTKRAVFETKRISLQ